MDIQISVDDGHELDRKTLELLKKHGLEATFYLPINSYGWDYHEMYNDHLVGNHTYSHPSDLKLLADDDHWREVAWSHSLVQGLDNFSGTFCPPRGRYNDRTKRVCRRFGYRKLRTTRVMCVYPRTGLVSDTTIHVYQRKEYGEMDWYEVALSLLEVKPRYFHVWWHSWEVERDKNWSKLDKLLNRLRED